MGFNFFKSEYGKLIIVIFFLLIILGGFLIYVSFPLLGTKTAILATMPVDPFDPIRGQYMIIGYEIGTVSKLSEVVVGDNVYVLLKEDSEGVSRYQSVSLKKPSEGILIRGKVKEVSGDSMFLDYGIEQYFFERNAKIPTQNITVKIKLSDFGGARIVELLQNGEPVKIEYADVNWKD